VNVYFYFDEIKGSVENSESQWQLMMA